MARNKAMKEDNGFTLIETIIAVVIVGILVVLVGFEYNGWMAKYKAESQIKEMYMDLMNARARATERNRAHFETGTGTAYSIYEDTNPGPDGDSTLQTGSDTPLPLYPKTVAYAINWTGAGNTITFDKKGMISPSGTIYLTLTVEPEYDCIVVSQTRINMGKWNAGTGTCTEK